MAGHRCVVPNGESPPGSVGFPPQNWPDVSGTPDMVQKSLQVVGEALEKPSAWVAIGWVFLSALQAETETALCMAVKF